MAEIKSPANVTEHESFLEKLKSDITGGHKVSTASTLATAATSTKETFLQKLGGMFKTAGKDIAEVITKAAPVAEFVGSALSLVYPGIGAEITAATQLVINTEGQFAQIGAQNGTGAQKSAAVLSVIEPLLTAALTKTGATSAATDSQTVINDIVKLLNSDPQLFVQIGQLASSLSSTSTAA